MRHVEKLKDYRLVGVGKSDLVIDWAKLESDKEPEFLLVFMPSAISASKITATKLPPLIFSRLKWAEEFGRGDVIILTDPVVQQTPGLSGAWYIHPDHDVISALTAIISEHASARGISNKQVLFYGSSLGGFGAIAAAALLPGSAAIAEVPQIDVANWLPAAVRKIELKVAKRPLSEYRTLYPEQVSLIDRLKARPTHPKVRIITNAGDYSYNDQKAFVSWVNSVFPNRAELRVMNDITGHRAIPREESVALIKRQLESRRHGSQLSSGGSAIRAGTGA